jgi:2,3-bisphosphoglycerate-dependent phosphoglycerate mutase
MKFITFILTVNLLFTGCTNTFYIVRHAEKEVASADSTMSTPGGPFLSDAGKKRAELLKDELKDKEINYIFSTPTKRTLATVAPLQELRGLKINLYSSDTIENFITRLKTIKQGDVLIVGHSNTVDDIVNKLSGKTNISSDLKDSEYDNLFIIKRSGKKFRFTRKKFGNE